MALTPGRTRRPANSGGSTAALLQVWASPALKKLAARAAAADGFSVSFYVEALIFNDGLHETITGSEQLDVTGKKSTAVQARVNPEIGQLAAERAEACGISIPKYLQLLIEADARTRGYLKPGGYGEGIGQAELNLEVAV